MSLSVDSHKTTTPYKFNWNNNELLTLKLTNLIIIGRILQREEYITPSLAIDLAAHVLTLVTTTTSYQATKVANISTNILRALAFLYGTAEAPLGTAFGLFAVGIHAVNVWAGLSLWKRTTHIKSDHTSLEKVYDEKLAPVG